MVKEREMEIGLPTDVKHVAHIGWDGPDGTTPTWVRRVLFITPSVSKYCAFVCIIKFNQLNFF